jgi:L-lactate dehydrogenase complex protein LldG
VSDAVREQILGRVREALARGRRELDRRGQSPPDLPDTSSLGAPATPIDRAARVEAFVARLESVDGQIHRCADEAEAANKLAELAGGASHAVSDSPLARRVAPGADLGPDASRAELLACSLGVTGAQAAIAETGTLVLTSGAERHRLISLLPPIHVAVLEASQIVETLGDALKLARGHPAVTFITGPSRTADIELTLVVGVHGPKELHVLLIDDDDG